MTIETTHKTVVANPDQGQRGLDVTRVQAADGSWSFVSFGVTDDTDHAALDIMHVERLEVAHDKCGRIDSLTVTDAEGVNFYIRLYRDDS